MGVAREWQLGVFEMWGRVLLWSWDWDMPRMPVWKRLDLHSR